jgi:sec-independent protein translocase protein TatA
MFGLGLQELVIVLVIIMVLFGAKRLPELSDGIGKAIRNFKKASIEDNDINVIPKRNLDNDKKEKPEKIVLENGSNGLFQKS